MAIGYYSEEAIAERKYRKENPPKTVKQLSEELTVVVDKYIALSDKYQKMWQGFFDKLEKYEKLFDKSWRRC